MTFPPRYVRRSSSFRSALAPRGSAASGRAAHPPCRTARHTDRIGTSARSSGVPPFDSEQWFVVGADQLSVPLRTLDVLQIGGVLDLLLLEAEEHRLVRDVDPHDG